MAKRDYLQEMRDGLDKWFRLVFYLGVLWIILNILPHLPDELGKRVADKLLSLLGL